MLCSSLGSLVVHIYNVNSKLLQAEGWSFRSQRVTSDLIAFANEVVEKAVMNKRLGKKCGQYFIYMVASNVASSFIFFHATRDLELVE